MVSFFFVDECRHPADQMTTIIAQYPAGALAVLKERVFLRIKYRFDVVIQRTDPVFVILVIYPGYV